MTIDEIDGTFSRCDKSGKDDKEKEIGMETVLVTGASGYIAQKLIGALGACPEVRSIIGIDIRPPAGGAQNFHFVKRDVREPLSDLFRQHQIDTVVHTAFVLPPIHDTKLMEDININGTRNVLFSSLQAGVKQFLYTSSTTAYGFHPDNNCPLTEDSPLRGNDDLVYSKTKKEIERIFVEQNLSEQLSGYGVDHSSCLLRCRTGI